MPNATYLMLDKETTLLRQLDIIANNVANTETSGFRKQFLVTHYNASNADKTVNFSQPASFIDPSSGAIKTTNRPLDVAIEGEGFFQISSPLGIRYTRAGNFRLNNDNQLVTIDGYQVLTKEQQPITITGPADKITISATGVISSTAGELGTIGVVKFSDPGLLAPIGKYLYQTDLIGTTAEDYAVHQGFLESSNVNSVSELTDLIETQRAATIANNFINNFDDIQTNTIKTFVNISK